MVSKRNREILQAVLSGIEESSPEPSPPSGYSPAMSAFKIMRRHYWDHIEHLFDMLPIVWGLETSEFEQLLRVRPGWLEAYRIHEVKPDEETWEHLSELLQLHFAMRMVVEPRGYAEWLRRPWTAGSPIGAQSPLQLILTGGDEALKALNAICLAQTQ